MGRGNRQSAGAATSSSAREEARAYQDFRKTGLEIVSAAVAQGDEARFRQISKEGRHDSQKAENAFLRSLPATFQFRGSEARLITSMPEIGWKRSDARYWIDFAVEHEGNLFPYNFKFGQGDGTDNVGSFGTLAYLLGGKIEHPLRPATLQGRKDLAGLVAGVLGGNTPKERYPNREYFCVHYNASREDLPYEERFRTLAVSQLRTEDMFWNTSNGLQVRFSTAEHTDPPRSREEARLAIAEGTYTLFKKLADPFHDIRDNLSQNKLDQLDKKLDG